MSTSLMQLAPLADMLLGLVICVGALDHIRRMNSRTRESIRWAFITLALGGCLLAFGQWLHFGAPGVEELLTHLGVAALLVADRRRPSDCPNVNNCDFQRRRPG